MTGKAKVNLYRKNYSKKQLMKKVLEGSLQQRLLKTDWIAMLVWKGENNLLLRIGQKASYDSLFQAFR